DTPAAQTAEALADETAVQPGDQTPVQPEDQTPEEGASQEQGAVASDTATDGQEGASHSERVPVEDAAPMKTARAEVGALDDQIGPPGQPATSAIFSQEDSFSFSAFAKQGTPAAVANQEMPAEFTKGMPAEQLSPEA